MRQLKTLLMVMLVLGALVLFPCLSWAGEQQQVFFREGVTDKDKAFVQKVVKLKESTNSQREYLAGLRELGLTDQKVVRYQYRVEEKNGKQQVRLIGKKTYQGSELHNLQSGDVIVMGGTQADLTLDFTVTKGFDEWHTDRILLDYDFYWSNCEELDGTDDSWAVNWDTEEAYCYSSGCDSDMNLVKQAIGGMGITTDDDNSHGNAWALLLPRNGSSWDAHGELTQEYCHTYGFAGACPSVTFTVSLGYVSFSISGDPEYDNHWTKAARDRY